MAQSLLYAANLKPSILGRNKMNSLHAISKSTISFIVVLLTLFSCSSLAIHGSGESYKVTHNLTQVTAVEVRGNMTLRIQNGSENQLTVIAQKEIHQNIMVQQTGNRLVIKPKEGKQFKTNQPIELVLTTNNLSEIKISGAVELNAANYSTDNLVVKARGAVQIDLNIQAQLLIIDASGAFEGYLSGDVSSLELTFRGASEINSFDLNATDAKVKATGASTAYIHAVSTLDVSVSGAATVAYKGNPRVSQRAAGASRIYSAE